MYNIYMTEAERQEIKQVYDLINKLVEGYGDKQCKDYAPQCANCLGQQLIGLLEWHVENLRV